MNVTQQSPASRQFMDELRAYYEDLRLNSEAWNELSVEAEELARTVIRGIWDEDDSYPLSD